MLAIRGQQEKKIDFLLNIGKLFTFAIHGQLILENIKLYSIGDYLLEQLFELDINNFSFLRFSHKEICVLFCFLFSTFGKAPMMEIYPCLNVLLLPKMVDFFR